MLRHGSSAPIWIREAPRLEFPPLQRDVAADVCVVGGGIAGLTTAYLLLRQGKSVVLVDDGPLGGGQTGCTTAHLANAIDDRYFRIEQWHGREGARLAAESHGAAISCLELIAAEEAIDCDFQRLDGFLLLAPEHERDLLEREYEAARRAGVDVDWLINAPFTCDGGPSLVFRRQGQFHPGQFMAGLAAAVVRLGGQVFGGTHATEFKGGLPAEVATARGPTVRCAAIVLATNSPVNDRVALHTKQAPYLTYVIAGEVPAEDVAPALYWDTSDPYHYARVSRRRNLPTHWLIVGGEDHKTGQADDGPARFARLERWARRRFPQLGSIEAQWSGQVLETVDGLAFIGRNPLDADNVYVVTGDSGMGMTHGAIAGRLLTDLILGRENAWAELYDPSRKSLAAAREWTSENLNVAAQYRDWVTPGALSSAEELAPGQGGILREGLSKLAVSRSADGSLCVLSAVCPHLKCIVRWNSTEQTWDCPCHGSRFRADGTVFQGPANSGLPAAEWSGSKLSPAGQASNGAA